MSRKELPRPGLVRAALAGQITNRQGAAALHMTLRQFQRLKARYREAGAPGLRHRGRGQPSPRRVAAELRAHVVALMTEHYAGFNDTHLTEKLREVHHLILSRESVRRLRLALGQPTVHRLREVGHRRIAAAAEERLVFRVDGIDGTDEADTIQTLDDHSPG